jgi:threonine dehydratase
MDTGSLPVSMSTHNVPTQADIEVAAARIKPFVSRTPVRTSAYFNDRFDSELFFKCEFMHKGGSFKLRGACNAVLSLDHVPEGGVATHSSGNHAKALALAASFRGVKAQVVMPSNSSKVKIEGVRELGAEITFCDPEPAARQRTMDSVLENSDAVFIHPYDNPVVIAGAATAAKELVEDIDGLDIVMTPVGGGGLLSGTSLSLQNYSPETKAVGVEPTGADDAYRSFTEGILHPSINPDTIADGLRTALSPLTFRIISENVDRIITVSEENIILAMREVYDKMEMLVEPSAAVPLAAFYEGEVESGNRIGIILSGGNIDPDNLPWDGGD